jgi:hypothetical protein
VKAHKAPAWVSTLGLATLFRFDFPVIRASPLHMCFAEGFDEVSINLLLLAVLFINCRRSTLNDLRQPIVQYCRTNQCRCVQQLFFGTSHCHPGGVMQGRTKERFQPRLDRPLENREQNTKESDEVLHTGRIALALPIMV